MYCNFYNDWDKRKMLQWVWTIGGKTASIFLMKSKTSDGKWLCPNNRDQVAGFIHPFARRFYARASMLRFGIIIGPFRIECVRYNPASKALTQPSGD